MSPCHLLGKGMKLLGVVCVWREREREREGFMVHFFYMSYDWWELGLKWGKVCVTTKLEGGKAGNGGYVSLLGITLQPFCQVW